VQGGGKEEEVSVLLRLYHGREGRGKRVQCSTAGSTRLRREGRGGGKKEGRTSFISSAPTASLRSSYDVKWEERKGRRRKEKERTLYFPRPG